jgi:signal transduction histidine kinase
MQQYLNRQAAMPLITPQRAAVPAALTALLLPTIVGSTDGLTPAAWLLYVLGSLSYLAILLSTIWDGLFGRPNVGLCRPWYQISTGLLATLLVHLSGDGLIQPILFTIPFVTAIESCGTRRAALVGSGYLLLLGSALALHHATDLLGLLYPLAGYGSLMLFMAAFVSLADAERRARLRADRLAEENARLARAAALSATLAERNRIARELHDTIAQGIAAVTLRLEAAQQLSERDPTAARQQLDFGLNYARQTLRDVRHSVWTLAAPTTAPTALPQALNELTDQLALRTMLQVTYRHSGPVPELNGDVATQLLRIVQEALQNVEQHAAAQSCSVVSTCTADRLQLWISDDGKGFMPQSSSRQTGRGFGLISMQERAQLIGAVLQMSSTPQRGTTITVDMPLFPA